MPTTDLRRDRGGRCPGAARGGDRRRSRSPRPWRGSPSRRRARSWPPDRTPGCCARSSSRPARCRSSPGPAPVCPVGRARWTWSWCSRPTVPTPARRPAVAEAVRRGCQLVVATPEDSLVARHVPGRYSTLLPTVTGDQLATAVVMLDLLDRLGLGPDTDADVVATALDDVAISCSPAPRPRGQPRRSSWPAASPRPVRCCGVAPCSPRGRRAGSPSRCVEPAAGPRSPPTPSTCCRCSRPPRSRTCSPTRSQTVTASLRPSLVVLDDGSVDPVVLETRDRLAEAGRRARRTRRGGHHRGRRRRRPVRRAARNRHLRRALPPAGSRRGRLSEDPPVDSPSMSTEGGTRAVVAALLANLGIAVTKFVAFLLTGFSSMLAEAIHSVADSGNQGLLLLGGKKSRQRGDRGASRSATAVSATSTPSSSRSCCSASAACSPSTRRTTSAHEVHAGHADDRATTGSGSCRSSCSSVAIAAGVALLPHRDPRDRQDPTRGVVLEFIRRAKAAGAAGDPARGLRGAARPGAGLPRRRPDPDHRERCTSTPPAPP